MLNEELLKLGQGRIQTVLICNRIKPGMAGKMFYGKDCLRSLYHLATSQVCILDSYWPTVSVLHHKPSLTVIQLWHALGKIKKSGWASVGKVGGRKTEVAEVLHMHANYDYVIAGAPIWNQAYCESFACEEDKILNLGLPRMDALYSYKDVFAKRIFEHYPQLKDNKVVLYAPTFRRSNHKEPSDLIRALSQLDCELIVKAHPNEKLDTTGALNCSEFSGMDLLSVADLVITDYSSIALEAAVSNVPTLYYLYDYDDYRKDTGINLDLALEMPLCTSFDVESLTKKAEAALTGDYPFEEFENYKKKFLISHIGNSTNDIARFVLCCIDGTQDQFTKDRK